MGGNTPTTNRHHRRSIRLPGCDYSAPGFYFITVCVKDRNFLFGHLDNGIMQLNELGAAAKQCWLDIPKHFPNAIIDEFVVMPNHIHGILQIFDVPIVGVQNFEPLHGDRVGVNRYQHIIPKSLGSIIRGFKIGVTKWWRQNGYEGILWQRNYYEHIIRDDESLTRIRQYIINNPWNWENDEENPNRKIKFDSEEKPENKGDYGFRKFISKKLSTPLIP